MRDYHPSLQHHRRACRVGDWILASAVPEWTTDRVEHTFTPPSQVLAGMFGASIRPAKDWIFRGSFYLDAAGDPVAIWRREE